MGNIIVLLILGVILGLSIRKVITEKKSGAKCIGCPHGKSCSNSCSSNLTLKK